jgi:hypothetical protein
MPGRRLIEQVGGDAVDILHEQAKGAFGSIGIPLGHACLQTESLTCRSMERMKNESIPYCNSINRVCLAGCSNQVKPTTGR